MQILQPNLLPIIDLSDFVLHTCSCLALFVCVADQL